MVEVAFDGKYKPIFLVDNSPIHKWVLCAVFFQLFLFNFPPPRTMPGDALNARSMNCKGENITLLSVSIFHILSLGI